MALKPLPSPLFPLIPFSKSPLSTSHLYNARSIYSYLRKRQKFTSWFRHLSSLYSLTQGVDYIFACPHLKGEPLSLTQYLTPSSTKRIALGDKSFRGKILFIRISRLSSRLHKPLLKPYKFVYVAQEEHSGRFKVGISYHPIDRIKAINVGNPEKLSLVSLYKANSHYSETLAHRYLSPYHIRSEWFSNSDGLSSILEPVNIKDYLSLSPLL